MDGVQAVPQELVPNLLGERSGAVPLPQTKEDVVERTQLAPNKHERVKEQKEGVPPWTLDQPSDQACRVSAETVHRQGRRHAYRNAATGPSTVAQPGDQASRDSADTVHRQSCCRAYCDTATGPSVSVCAEDGRTPAGAVHRQCGGRPCDQPDQPGDQARRYSAEAVHRQCCRHACRDTATGPSDTDDFEDCESPAGAVHRLSSGRACCDAATDPSVSNCVEDSGSLEERIPERIVEHTRDVPVPQFHELIVEYVKNIPQERFSERAAEQTVELPTPQILEEIAEAVSAPLERVQQRTVEHVATVKNVPQERISGKIGEQIDDDTVPVDQPGDQVRRDPQACGVATTGPSASNCGEDVGSLARAVRQQSRESTCDHADQPGNQARRSLTDSAHDQRVSRANVHGPRKRRTKAEYEAMLKIEAKLGIWPSMLTPFDKWIQAAE